ncbi:hypothetical protein D6783_00160 [Candidatus Woesearchaeota archaeon]|nr:MAG: hypothetical protein D6783_00160 [Candidatus Woesearchaeota archaeon]
MLIRKAKKKTTTPKTHHPMNNTKNNARQRLATIKEALTTRYYPYSFVLITLLYFGINAWANQLYISLPALVHFSLSISIPFALFTFLNAVLVGLVANLLHLRYANLKRISKAGAVGGAGAAAGLIAGACPGCFVGVFPALAGLFGSSLSLLDLPFNGIEILAASAALLAIAIYYLTNPIACAPMPSKKNKQEQTRQKQTRRKGGKRED